MTDSQFQAKIAFGHVRAEPWGDINNPDAPRQWLPVIGGYRLTRGKEPCFKATKAEALAEGYAAQARAQAAAQ